MNNNMQFYIMRKTYTDFARPVKLETQDQVRKCPKCGAIFVERLSALKVYFEGKKLGDYYSVSNYNVISGRLQKLLIESKITGFVLKDMDIEGWYDSRGKDIHISQYDNVKEIDIVGRGGWLTHKNGEVVEKCDECGAKKYKQQCNVNGLSVNLDEWDKTEMFYFNNWSGVIIVTERVKELIEKNNMKNINFINIKDFRFD